MIKIESLSLEEQILLLRIGSDLGKGVRESTEGMIVIHDLFDHRKWEETLRLRQDRERAR